MVEQRADLDFADYLLKDLPNTVIMDSDKLIVFYYERVEVITHKVIVNYLDGETGLVIQNPWIETGVAQGTSLSVTTGNRMPESITYNGVQYNYFFRDDKGDDKGTKARLANIGPVNRDMVVNVYYLDKDIPSKPSTFTVTVNYLDNDNRTVEIDASYKVKVPEDIIYQPIVPSSIIFNGNNYSLSRDSIKAIS